MAEATAVPSAGMDRATEEAGYYHECALNATWTGSRLAMGGLSFLFGSFVFAYFYLRSLNSNGRWMGSGYHAPSMIEGTLIMLLILLSAGIQYAAVQRLKAGNKRVWQIGASVALILACGAIAFQVVQLLTLPFFPGSSGFASVFVSFYPVFVTILFAGVLWLWSMLMRARFIPAISFIEQPPTYQDAFAVQRFQATLSGFTAVWNYLAVIGILFWVLFYVL